MMEEVSMDVEASANPKKPRLEPKHTGGEGSNIQSATDLEQAVPECESGGLLLQEVSTPAMKMVSHLPVKRERRRRRRRRKKGVI
jgi:hypothetical protein